MLDLGEVRERLAALGTLPGVTRAFYALKANPHPAVLAEVGRAGFGFECVSPGELAHVRTHQPDLDPARLLFTPNFAPRHEYAGAFDAGAHVTLDALHPLTHWGDLLAGRDVLLRIDLGWGVGHHTKVVTGGPGAKFGIPVADLDMAVHLLDRVGARAIGLHAHAGSGILDPAHWTRVASSLADAARQVPHVRILNVGGGFGVPMTSSERPLDLDALGEGLARIAAAHPQFELWIEPGRLVVAGAGVLLARVTQIKHKDGVRWIGVATGMNSLIRPALYGAQHGVMNLSRPHDAPTGPAHVVGPICESGDVLGHAVPMPDTHEGDVVLIATTGAYGRSMSSDYNLRPPAPEFVLHADTTAASA